VVLEPLALPRSAALAAVAASPAVQLFMERARQLRPTFELTAQEAEDVAAVVQRLDGIPLAIELAAARVRLLPPRALLDRLDRRLDLQARDVDLPSRQRTLRATVAWSYDLLGQPERALLARLSVLGGRFSLGAAEAVGGAEAVGTDGSGEDDVLDLLSSLVEHSLVGVDACTPGGPWFRILDTVREFAGERLEEAGDVEAVMRRLARYAGELSAEAGPLLGTPQGRWWAERLDAELDVLRSVVDWAVSNDEAELAVRVPAPLARYWWSRGLLSEIGSVAERTAALPSASRLAPEAAALLLWCRGSTRIAVGRAQEAGPLLREAEAAARALGNDRLLAHALFSLALTLPYEDGAAIRATLEESVRLFRRLDDLWGVALALIPLGELALREGDLATAVALHEEALDCAVRMDDPHMRAQSLDQLALDALLSGDLDGARQRLTEAAALHRRLADREGLAYCLEGLAALALARGRGQVSARLLGAAARIRQVAGIAVWPLLEPLSQQLAAAVRAAVGDAVDAQERAAGAALDPHEALDLGLTAATGEAEPHTRIEQISLPGSPELVDGYGGGS
jgi:tetratricopeptide (TPR) repeat protein